MSNLRNLLEGIDFPIKDDQIGQVANLLSERLRDHRQVYELERAQATAVLESIRKRCKHPGAKSGYNERDGDWMATCPICGESK